MTGEFSTYECEELMVDGEPCVRLFGHKGIHWGATIDQRIQEARRKIQEGRSQPGKTADELHQLAREQREHNQKEEE